LPSPRCENSFSASGSTRSESGPIVQQSSYRRRSARGESGGSVSSDVPLWLALLPNIVAFAAIVAAEVRDRRRLVTEREIQLGNERRQAYATLAQLTARPMDISNPEVLSEVYEAYEMVEILSEDERVLEAADELVRTWSEAWSNGNRAVAEAAEGDLHPFYTPQFQSQADQVADLRADFVASAREEIGVKKKRLEPPRSTGELPE
jgi:hypothetical protein